MHDTRSLEPPSLMKIAIKKKTTTVCFFLKCVSYRHWQPLGFECGAKLGKIKQTLKLVLQNISILWIKFELSVMSLAPRGQKTGSKSPSTTSGRFHRAAVHRFSCCLIRLSSVLLAASGGKPSVPLRWAQLVLCDGRQLSVAMSHARRDKSPCFGVLFSSDANCIHNIEDIRPHRTPCSKVQKRIFSHAFVSEWWIIYSWITLKKIHQ